MQLSEQLHFCGAADGIHEFARRIPGKLLIVTDGSALDALSAASSPRTVSAVLENADALPLFTMPDGVGGVIAAGGEHVLRAARYFAELRRVPCLLVPTSGALDGAFGKTGRVMIAGDLAEVPLKAAEVICDFTYLQRSIARAYCRILLARLALFELRALSRLRLAEYSENCERAYEALRFGGEPSMREIVEANASLRTLEGAGMPAGEGIILASEITGEMPELAAYHMLLTAYEAFFRYGKARRYTAVDYRARANAAGVLYAELNIPTVEEVVHRAVAFERMREMSVAELSAFRRDDAAHLRTVRTYAGRDFVLRDITETWKKLPEFCPSGLTAVMRDFGLLEF